MAVNLGVRCRSELLACSSQGTNSAAYTDSGSTSAMAPSMGRHLLVSVRILLSSMTKLTQIAVVSPCVCALLKPAHLLLLLYEHPPHSHVVAVLEADWPSVLLSQGTNSAAYTDSSMGSSSATAPSSGRHLLQVREHMHQRSPVQWRCLPSGMSGQLRKIKILAPDSRMVHHLRAHLCLVTRLLRESCKNPSLPEPVSWS